MTKAQELEDMQEFIDDYENIHNQLEDLIDDINNKELKQEIENGELEENRNICKEVLIGNKTYKLLGEYIELKNKQQMITLYFVDNTELVKTEEKYINSQNCIGIIT